jgi:tetratricopeptide (TPR) repeat protein
VWAACCYLTLRPPHTHNTLHNTPPNNALHNTPLNNTLCDTPPNTNDTSGEALSFLTRWLGAHPTHGAAAAALGPPPDSSQALSHAVRSFEAAVAAAPQDAELQLALGVLHHLDRRYERAIGAFQRALELRPSDYRCARCSSAFMRERACVYVCVSLWVVVTMHDVWYCVLMCVNVCVLRPVCPFAA